jgi:hypothetical protein
MVSNDQQYVTTKCKNVLRHRIPSLPHIIDASDPLPYLAYAAVISSATVGHRNSVHTPVTDDWICSTVQNAWKDEVRLDKCINADKIEVNRLV